MGELTREEFSKRVRVLKDQLKQARIEEKQFRMDNAKKNRKKEKYQVSGNSIYLTRSKNKSASHLWNSFKDDTYCKLWSTGGMSQYGNYIESDHTNKRICVMCQNNKLNEECKKNGRL